MTRLFVCLALLTATTAVSQDDPQRMMHDYLFRFVDVASEARAERVEKLDSADDVAAYQKRLREFFIERIGGFPEQTPLNPEITGVIERDGYRIEKVLFESRPNHRVTALMYVPNGPGPFPAVLVPCGHSANGKASETYQRGCILLAKHGMAVLCFDPVEQGERYGILDENGKPVTGGTQGHTYIGVGATLLGIDVAGYEIWDGVRAIDYLVSRDDVDPERIGCAGNSGGGTQTSYFMALDDRIKVAAPSCYITTFPKLIATIGAQDAEQDIYGQIAFGMDHPDYVIMRAPKPTLICAATRDFFDIEGTWDAFRDAKRVYTKLGYPERVSLVETNEDHGWSVRLREATTHWMQRWLLDVDQPVRESESEILTDEECWVTPKGQVMHLDGERSAYDLNRALAEKVKPLREKKWAAMSPDERRKAVRDVTGVRQLEDIDLAKRVSDRFANQPPETTHETITLQPESGIWLTARLYGLRNSTRLHLFTPGQGLDEVQRTTIDSILRKGEGVVIVELRGIGATESKKNEKGWGPRFGPDWQDVMLGLLVEKPYLTMRTEDILSVAKWLEHDDQLRTAPDAKIVVHASGETVPPALHASFLEPELFDAVELEDGVESWHNVVMNPLTPNQFVNTVFGALQVYDLPLLQVAK